MFEGLADTASGTTDIRTLTREYFLTNKTKDEETVLFCLAFTADYPRIDFQHFWEPERAEFTHRLNEQTSVVLPDLVPME